jgi:hypothetical protein
MLTRLLWSEARSFFDSDLMGGLPDVFVRDTTADDWQVVFDLVAESGWRWEFYEGDVTSEPLAASQVFSRPADAELVCLRVWPIPQALVIFRPWSAETVEFDVDVDQWQGQENLDIFCQFLATIGRALNKPTLTCPEGDGTQPVLGFDPEADRVVLLAEPWA